MKSQLISVLAAVSLCTIGAAPQHDPPPHITSIWLSKSAVHYGEIVHGRVTSSKNTASVEVRVGGYSTVMKKVNATTFVVDYQVPWLPTFLHRMWTVRVIARNIRGDQNERDTTISIR